jgi:hypothetical protein
MTTPLSPAAQAVMDAAACVPIPDQQAFGILRLEIAAALRAAADQVVPEPPVIVEGGRTYEEAWTATVHDVATLLQQRSAPAPAVVPVAVSERLPGKGDCDAEGMCWLFSKVESEWRLLNVANPGVPHLKYCFSHWLPAHAIPLPQAGEVEG